MTPRHSIAKARTLIVSGKVVEAQAVLCQAETEASQLESEYARRGQQLVRAKLALGAAASIANAAKDRIGS